MSYHTPVLIVIILEALADTSMAVGSLLGKELELRPMIA